MLRDILSQREFGMLFQSRLKFKGNQDFRQLLVFFNKKRHLNNVCGERGVDHRK